MNEINDKDNESKKFTQSDEFDDKIRELERELEILKSNEATPSNEYVKKYNRKKETEALVKKANEMIYYHKSEIVRLEMIKNGGFPLNYLEIPNLTHYTYKMLHSFALFLAENKVALECCGIYELGVMIKYFRNDTLNIKIKARQKETLKDIQNKSKLHYGERPAI